VELSLAGIEHGPSALREALERVGITDTRTAFELPSRLSISEINDVLEFLYYACEFTLRPAELRKHRNLLISPFSTGFTFGPCGSPRGRFKALESSLKRALLLNEHVLVPNPFAYSRTEPFTANTDIAKLNLSSLLNHVYNSLTLLEEGLIGFYPNAITVCTEHKETLEREEEHIHECLMRKKDDLIDGLLRGVQARLLIDKAGYFFLRFEGDHPIMNPGGQMDLIFGEGAVPEDIKHRVGQTISRDDLVRFGSVIPILDRMEHLAFLFSGSSHFCKLDLLATDILEIEALETANRYSSGSNDLFAVSDFSVPDFSRLSLKNLTRLATREAESLSRFRGAFTRLLEEINDEAPHLSLQERSDLIHERLGAEREHLNKRLMSQRKKALRRTMERVVVGGLSLALGLFTGLAGTTAAAFQAFGGVSMAKGIVEGVVDSTRVPDELKADSWYFLWQLGRAKK